MTAKDLTDNQLKILRCLSDGLLHVRKSISDSTCIIGKTTSNVLTRMELFDLVERANEDGKMGWKITGHGMKLVDGMIDRQYYERDEASEIEDAIDDLELSLEPLESVPKSDDSHIEIVPPQRVADEKPAEYFAAPEVFYTPREDFDLDEIRRRCVEFAVALRGEKGLERIDVYSRAIERLANACLLLK